MVHKVVETDEEEVACGRRVGTKARIAAARTPGAYGHSYRSCVAGIPCKVGSACWEDQGCKENLVAVEEAASAAARGASQAGGGSS